MCTSSESSIVVVQSPDFAPNIPREIGVLVPAMRTDVCRFWTADPPETKPSSERTIALPAAFKGVVRDDMFFVNVQFQNRWTWSMMDTGASRNLMSSDFFAQLFHQPELRPPGATRIIAGNGASLDLRGWTTLVVAIGGHWIFHEFGIVGDMPLDAVCGAELMKSHAVILKYVPDGPNVFELGNASCAQCEEGRTQLLKDSSPQLRFMDPIPKFGRLRPRNRREVPILVACANADGGSSAPEPAVESEADIDVKYARTMEILSDNSILQGVLYELKVSELPLPECEKRRVVDLVRRNLDAFATSPTDVGRTHLVMHKIDIGNNLPFKERVRPVPHSWREFMDQELDKLLAIGAISEANPGDCPFASRCVVVRKKDGTFRLCVDYRRLNAITVKDSYPLPRIDEILSSLGKARVFASLDLLMGYHEVEVDPRDRAKTAFVTHRGLFVFNVMPFGLTNAPATFQRLMNNLFQSRLGIDILVYLDDILCYAETLEQLYKSLEYALQTVISAGLKCKAKKCKLFSNKIEYLGHIVANGAYSADPEKIAKILQWPVPKTGGEIASFLGLCGYYRELIPKFAEIADPLYREVHSLELVWSDDLNSAFEQLKRAMTSDKIVRIADPQLPFILQTDASSVAIGAVLLQFYADANRELPVAFYSRALSQTERRYSTYEKELLAVVKATEHFRVYLLGRSYTLRTDHSPIRGLSRSKLEIMRVERWAMRLSEFDFQVEIVKGRDNVVADALSRIQWLEGSTTSGVDSVGVGKEQTPEEGGRVAGSSKKTVRVTQPESVDEDLELCVEYSDSDDPLISSEELVYVELENVTDDSTPGLVAPTLESIREAQASDPDFVVVVSWVKKGELPSEQVQEGLTEFPRACVHSFFQLHVVENVLVIHDDDGSPNQRILVPKSMVTLIIRYFHEGPLSAHDAFQRTYAKIAQQYFWLYMKRDISLYVAACDVCIKFRRLAREPRGSLHPIHVGFRNEIVALDCVGGGNSLPTTARGNRYFLTMIDLFTKYCVVIPMIDHCAASVVDAFHSHWVLVFGSPYRVHTDQGLEFEGEFSTFCEVWRIARSRTTAYHPQGNGACERVNQTIKHNLRKLINECDLGSWDRMLPLAAFAYNTVVHNSTGFSPFFLTFGADPRVPSDLLIGPPAESDMGQLAYSLVKTLSFAFENARNALMANQRRSKDSYDTGVVERIFTTGQKVFLRIKNLFMKKGSKLLSPWSGPFEVMESKGILVKIRDMRVPDGRIEWVHHDRLSNPSIFYERRSKSKDLSIEPPERSKETPKADKNEVGKQSEMHASPVHSDSEDLTPEPVHNPHTRTSVNIPPVITRSGRAVRPNHNRDFVYNHADFCGMMSTLPTNLRVPEGMATATAQMWSRIEQEQRIQTVQGLLPSEFAFIHRRTGTHYVYNPRRRAVHRRCRAVGHAVRLRRPRDAGTVGGDQDTPCPDHSSTTANSSCRIRSTNTPETRLSTVGRRTTDIRNSGAWRVRGRRTMRFSADRWHVQVDSPRGYDRKRTRRSGARCWIVWVQWPPTTAQARRRRNR